MDVRYKPKFGRQGTTLAVIYAKQLDAGITASAQTTIPFVAPCRKYAVLRISVQQAVVVAGGSSITLSVVRNSPVITPNSVFYNVPFELRGLTANQVYNVPIASNVNTAVLQDQWAQVNGDLVSGGVANPNNCLLALVLAGGTVTTQPVGLIVTVEVAILE